MEQEEVCLPLKNNFTYFLKIGIEGTVEEIFINSSFLVMTLELILSCRRPSDEGLAGSSMAQGALLTHPEYLPVGCLE